MRSLAQGRYTDAQVRERLAGSYSFGKRFELLDRDFVLLDENVQGITSGVMEHSVDRDNMGALTLSMHANEDLRGMSLKYFLRPYYVIHMPDGGTVEYPEGCYLWVDAERNLPHLGQEEWQVTLADQTWRLSLASVGPQGFLVRRGQRVTDIIRDIYADLGYEDLSGIVDSDETIDETKFWIYLTPNTPAYQQRKDAQQQYDNAVRELERDDLDAKARLAATKSYAQAVTILRRLEFTAPVSDETYVTWGAVLSILQAGIGYAPPYFDLTGERPIAQPARDLSVGTADHQYRTDTASILKGLSVSPDWSSVANRVIVKATNADGFYGIKVADANDLYPNHPLAQRQVGDYIDVMIEDSTASTAAALELRAKKELGERLARHQTVSVTLGPNPAHEPFDLVEIVWTDDPELSGGQLFTQRGFSFDLFGASMQLDLGLVTR